MKSSTDQQTAMTSTEVIDLYSKLENLGIEIWIDGGWGVDALLGEQTRHHRDLDIAIQQKDVPKLRALLEAQGYKEVERDDTSPWNFVLGDDEGREIDVHAIVLDEKGNGLYGPVEKGVMYPSASLTGTGTVDGHKVKCISAEYMVKFHIGYELSDSDLKDVSALCERFGIDYPEEYLHFKKSDLF
ncbi:MAG: nucleotidyltransferase domain-containing protein [Dehalococcoidia bacterium]